MSTQQIDRKSASRLLNITVRTVDRYIVSGKLQSTRSDGRIWLNKKEVLELSAKRRRNLAVQRMSFPLGKIDMSIDDVYPVSAPKKNGNYSKRAIQREYIGDNYIGNNRNLARSHNAGALEITDSEGSAPGSLGTVGAGSASGGESPVEIYKKLFQELQQELKIKQERLEGANYRVGQLEAQISHSVPRLDHIRALNESNKVQEQLQQQIQEIQAAKTHLQKTLQETKAAEANIFRNYEQARLQSENLSQVVKTEKIDKKIYLFLLFIILLLQPLWLVLSLR